MSDPLAEIRLVLEVERQHITGVPRSTWREMEHKGLTPVRRQVSGKRTGWLLSDLLEWVRSRPVASMPAPAAANAARRGGGRAA